MNKIFLNNKILHLLIEGSPEAFVNSAAPRIKDSKELARHIDSFEEDSQSIEMSFVFESEKKIKKLFLSIYELIEAAGGIVRNKDGKVLMIYRHEKWDLPKGKIEKGEETQEAALREVEEECGISELKIVSKMGETYHTYMLKGKPILKVSHWFVMDYNGKSTQLVPQTEEAITEARWMSEAEIKSVFNNAYASIVEIVQAYFNSKR